MSSAAMAALLLHAWAASVDAGVAVSIGRNFTGSTDSLAWKPCPSGSVNADYFAELNIDTFAVYRKTDGTLVKSMAWQDFWNAAGVTIPGNYGWNSWDFPRLVYDPSVQRWFAALNVGDSNDPGTSAFLLAVSATADPTGPWNGVPIDAAPGGDNFASTVSMGLDARGVYLSSVAATASGQPVGCTLLSLPKADLLSIPPIITNRTWFGTLSAGDHGYNIKPAICLDDRAAGNVLATAGRGVSGDNNTRLISFAVQNGGGPGPASLSDPIDLSVSAYVAPPNALQPDGSRDLATLNASFRADVCSVGGVLFAAEAVQAGAHSAIRWYRISAADQALLQSGTISDQNLDLFFPSIAANTNGTVVIACNGSGASTDVSCYAVAGQTLNGVTTFGNLLLLKAGTASYQNLDPGGNNDWGYFSTTCVDPTDSNVFWTINAFASGPTSWSTQITQLLTGPSPRLSIANAAGGLLLSWPVTTVPFQLESAPTLSGNGSWGPVTQAPGTNDATVSVLVPATNASAFFRLTQQ